MYPSAGTALSTVPDKVLAKEGVERNIQLHLPSFLGVARIVAETELIAIVPHRYGVVTAGSEAIRVLSVPVALPDFSVKQHWHEHYRADASNRWLRQAMARLFSEYGRRVARDRIPLPGEDYRRNCQ